MARREEAENAAVILPRKLASEARRHLGGRSMAAFVARAVRHELERERLGLFLEDLEREIGPADERMVAEIEAEWPRR